MTTIPSGFDYRGAHYYRGRDNKETFYYLAGEPTPDRDPSGNPALTFLVTDQGALLQLSTRWEVPADVLEGLREPLHEQFPDAEPSLIRFSPAPISMAGVSLTLTDRDKEENLQTVTSSNFPPYSSLFNVTLTADQKARVGSALNGRTGVLQVTYRFSLATTVSVETSISGDISADVAELGSDASRNDCDDQIETALAEGRLQLTRTGADDAPAELSEKADHQAKEKAIEILHRMTSQMDLSPDTARLKASAVATMPVEIPLSRSTDVGSWFSGGAAKVTVAPGTVGATKEGKATHASVRVEVGFNLKDVPVAFVQLTWDKEQATIGPPIFNSVALNGHTDKPLIVKTFYTDGGSPYETNLQSLPAKELKLTPPDIGLAQVLVDASARRKAGSTQAQIQVNYKPKENGTADEHLTRLRYGDWTDSWYVVTRSPDLGGSLEVEWTETNADGSVITHPTVTTDKTEITL
jgi:hypothetical protein